MPRNLRYDATARLWRCRRMVRGRVYKASFTRKEDASEWLRKLERLGAGLEPIPQLVTLQEAWAIYRGGLAQRGTTPETLRYYGAKYAALTGILGEHAILNRVTEADVSRYLETRRDGGIGNRTLKSELTFLHRLAERAEAQPRWAVPPLKITENPRKVPTPAQWAAVWRQLEGPAAVALGLCTLTGMRASEAFRCHASDYDAERAVIRLSARKAGDVHVVPVVPTLAALLPAKGPLVKATEHEVSWALEAASKATKGPRLSGPGIGRHCFATWAVALCGYTEDKVGDALGHARPGATRRYIHAEAVEPIRRPMALAVEALVLAELGKLEGAPLLSFKRGR